MRKKKNEDPTKWRIVGADNTRVIKAKKGQMTRFLVFIIIIIALIAINLVMVYRFNTNLFEVCYNKILDSMSKNQEEIVEQEEIEEVALEDEEVEISEEKKEYIWEDEEYKDIYSIADVFDDAVELYEIDNSNKDKTILYMMSLDYSTDPSYEYFISIEGKLDSGKNEMLVDKEIICGGMVQEFDFKKIDLDDYEYIVVSYIEELMGKGKSKRDYKINIDTDLSAKSEIIYNKPRKDYNWYDLIFDVLSDSETYETTYGTVTSDTFLDYYFSYTIYKQYGDLKVIETHLDLNRFPNENKLSLEQYVKDVELVENVGAYRVQKKYVVHFSDEETGEILEDVILTHEQMLEFSKGKDVLVGGKTYNIKDLGEEINFKWTVENKKNIKIDNINAIEYNLVGRYDDGYTVNNHYIAFIIDDYIYTVQYDNDYKDNKEIKYFIDNIKVNK